jgi:hypothetical protein
LRTPSASRLAPWRLGAFRRTAKQRRANQFTLREQTLEALVALLNIVVLGVPLRTAVGVLVHDRPF